MSSLPPALPPPVPPLPRARPLPFRESRARRTAAWVAIVLPLLYAGFFRLAFATHAFDQSGGVVSVSFIISVPFVVGALSVAIGRWLGSDKWLLHAVLGPTFSLTLGLIICLIAKIEAFVCVIMAAPILYIATVLGGCITHFLLPRNSRETRLYVTLAAFLPVLAAMAEGSLHWPTEMKAIRTTMVIHAPAERIWPEIASVRAIPAESIPNRWIYRVGFPKPIAATLDREGIGGIRTATFERGVSFFETVTEWDKNRRLAFTIHADPNFIPHTAFDQHIIVGGRFYDVLDGIYEIEPLGPGVCRLHLTSHHRLGTRFNAYAGWWSQKIMDQIQHSIMTVIRQRAETGMDAAGG